VRLFRKSLFWILALVVLGGAFLLVEERVEEADKEEARVLRLFPFEADDVKAFWISNSVKNVSARVVRQAEGWWLERPLSARGDDEGITKMLQNVLKARKDAVLFEKPEAAKLEELGLEPVTLEMGFEFAGGEVKVRFGDQGPTHNVAYAMLAGDPRVFRIHADVRTEADIGAYELRDKTVLDFDPLKLQRLVLERRGRRRVVLQHDRGRWTMVEPNPGRADQVTVLETLFAVKDSEIKAFVEETPQDLSRYGLTQPRINISIRYQDEDKNGPRTVALSVGGKDRARRGYYARAAGADNVFLVEESLVKALLADTENWRDSDQKSGLMRHLALAAEPT
jgi:hypothetical protein